MTRALVLLLSLVCTLAEMSESDSQSLGPTDAFSLAGCYTSLQHRMGVSQPSALSPCSTGGGNCFVHDCMIHSTIQLELTCNLKERLAMRCKEQIQQKAPKSATRELQANLNRIKSMSVGKEGQAR
jgi:hypothetical protein